MKTRSSDCGIALVALVVMIVVLGLLGTLIVSFMGSKLKSYPIQLQSYQAFNLANAGAEFAIRYAKDRFENEALREAVTVSLGSEVTVNCGSDCGNRSFRIQYHVQEPVSGSYLTSIATVGNASREVRVNKFAGFVAGGGIVHSPVVDEGCLVERDAGCYDANCVKMDKCPSGLTNNKASALPVTSMFDDTVYVKYIEIRMDPTTGSANKIQQLYFGGAKHYDSTSECGNPDLNPNCMGKAANEGVCVPKTDGTGCPAGSLSKAQIPYQGRIPTPSLNLVFDPGSATEIIEFNSASISGTYYVDFYYDVDPNYSNPLKKVSMKYTIK